MGTLDRIMEMHSQGISDNEIISTLKNEGISPQEINDSLNQAKVKMAVSQSEVPIQGADLNNTQNSQIQPPAQPQETEQFQPQETEQFQPQETEQSPQPANQMPVQEQMQNQANYPPENYPPNNYPPENYPQEYYPETPQAYP